MPCLTTPNATSKSKKKAFDNSLNPRGLKNKRCHDLRGRKFGFLSPIEIDSSRNGVYWKCQCKCGKRKSVAAKHLVGNKITSCGCQHHRTGKSNPCWKGYQDISGKYWKTIRRNATNRGLPFCITIEYAWNIFQKQDSRCALTGIPLIFRSKSHTADGTASLDRINSSKGYSKGNVQWVDKKINTIKWDLSLDNFLRMCKLVVEHKKL